MPRSTQAAGTIRFGLDLAASFATVKATKDAGRRRVSFFTKIQFMRAKVFGGDRANSLEARFEAILEKGEFQGKRRIGHRKYWDPTMIPGSQRQTLR